MAHMVGSSATARDVMYSRDIDGGPGILMKPGTGEYVELSTDASVVVEVDRSHQAQVLTVARGQGLAAAAQTAEVAVRLTVRENSGAAKSHQAVSTLLVRLAVTEWLEIHGGRS